METFGERFKDTEGAGYYWGALSSAVLGYGLGIAGLFADSAFVNLPAVLLLAHSMLIAAYLIHDCGHNSVFRSNAENARLGGALSWICGASYGTYEDIRNKHFRHHVDNEDVMGFDQMAFLGRHPTLLRVIEALEWLYIPAHELLMHTVMIAAPFLFPQRRDQRLRTVGVVAVRGGVFLCVAILWPKAALLYALAYMLLLIVLRFIDSSQHDYTGILNLFGDEPSPNKGSRAFEEAHTFSNPISLRHEKLNWLVLNMCFHNAHHKKPTTPWYRLPELHREIYGDGPEPMIPFWAQCRAYHRARVDRIFQQPELNEDDDPLSGQDYLRLAQEGDVLGGNAVSFLTSF